MKQDSTRAKGPIATLLVTNGTLKAGQSVVAGTTSGKIRVMTNFKGEAIRKALLLHLLKYLDFLMFLWQVTHSMLLRMIRSLERLQRADRRR